MTHKLTLMIILCVCFTSGEATLSDVTHDGIDDEINIGEQSVVVIDGKSGKRYVVVSGNEFLMGADVVDILPPMEHYELAIQISAVSGGGHWTTLYGFDGEKFDQISENIPGDIFLADDGSYWGYYSIYRTYDYGTFNIPVPLYENRQLPYLRACSCTDVTQDEVTVNASSSREITTKLPGNVLVVIYTAVREKDVNFSLKADGEILTEGSLEAGTPLVYDYETIGNVTLTLSFDNTYSIMTPKVVFYSVDIYEQ